MGLGSRRAESSRQAEISASKAVDRFGSESCSSRQDESRAEKPVDRFAPESSSSRQDQSRAEIPVDRIMTPHEAWYGRKPEVGNLRVFGSVCYVHVPEEKRTKLDERAELGIFIGYSSIVKAYRV